MFTRVWGTLGGRDKGSGRADPIKAYRYESRFGIMVASQEDLMSQPWYRRVHRWGQTNLTEIDGAAYDRAFWRDYWKKTRTEGIIVNAGGIVAYYPSDIPLHYRAGHLGDR